jgi:Domain of unknown function (DUF222)/HNH endonuclease
MRCWPNRWRGCTRWRPWQPPRNCGASPKLTLRQAWRGEGARSTADLLSQRLRLTRGEARAQTETAISLASLPQTAAALQTGAIGLGQAQVAAHTAKELRPDVREELDRLVATDGPELDRRQLRQRVDTWTHTVDPEALAARERRAWTNRRLTLNTDNPDGMVCGQFALDPIGGATLIAALDAQSRKTTSDDDRTFPQRQADALVELARRALDAGELPQVAAQRPHVLVITTAEQLHCTPGAPPAQLDGIGPISSTTAQMLCCDAELTPVVMTRNGAVLDVGRTRREPTKAQRLAIIARDQTCVGCGAPASRCQIHHVRWWHRDHGPTDETNLCLTCWVCHHRIHENGWSSATTTDATPSPHPTPDTYLWGEALHDPAVGCAAVADAVVEPVWAALPELDLVGA